MKQYFVNIDPLRFLAFFCIFTMHFFLLVPIDKVSIGNFGFSLNHITFNIGELGFTFFCVLSGFLNSFIIFNELKEKQKLHVGKFYIRRILRIWPLYYVFIIFAFAIFPQVQHYFFDAEIQLPSVGYFLVHLVNFQIPHIQDDALPMYSNLWAISLEEQFYLFLPWLVLLFRGMYRWLYLLLLVTFVSANAYYFHDFDKFFFHTLCLTSDFCLGIFFARQASGETLIFKKLKQLPRWATLIPYAALLAFLPYAHFSGLVYGDTSLPVYLIEKFVLGLLVGLIIFDQCFSERPCFRFAKLRPLVYLGQISFGLYIFHDIFIFLSFHFVTRLPDSVGVPLLLLVVYTVALLVTVVFSILSYRYFESWFLRLKSKFY